VKCFVHAADALKELPTYNPAIILSDMKMGKMNGVDFLLKGKEILPCAVRMALSGYADINLMIGAIRYAQIFDYIQKPYDPEDVEVRLQKALAQYEENIRSQQSKGAFENVNKSLSQENQKLKELAHLKNNELDKVKSELGALQRRLLEITDGLGLKRSA